MHMHRTMGLEALVMLVFTTPFLFMFATGECSGETV